MSEFYVNIESMTDFLIGLLKTPSPTGYYPEAIAYVEQAFATIPGLSLVRTTKGSLLATWKGQASTAPRALTAHIDTLGLMVKEIKASGRLKTAQLGGFAWNAVEFEGVTVRTQDDRRYRGTVVPINPSIHVNNKLTEQPRNADTMEVRLDAVTHNADETRALGINIGDFVFIDPRVEVTDTGFIRSRHLDDKAGVAVIYGALLALGQAGLVPAQDTSILIANYEEVGHGGASGLPANLAELLTVDMGAIGDGQNSDEFSACLCVKDSSGPYHLVMNNKLRRLAETFNIAYRVDLYPYYASDGSAYWRAGGVGRVGLVGPGVDASHAYERTHKDSLNHTAHLIARYLLDEEA